MPSTISRSFAIKISVTVKQLWVLLMLSAIDSNTALAKAIDSKTDLRPTITFVCEARPEQPNYKVAMEYLTDVFDQLGYRYIQRHVHTVEAIRSLKVGEVDGDCGRLDGFLEASDLKDYVAIGPAYSHASFSRWYMSPPTMAREHQKVGYNSNAILLKKHLLAMGYKRFFPIDDQADLPRLLLNGEIDLVVNYEKSMSFITQSDEYKKIKSSDSFMTLPVRPYMHKSLVEEFGERWLDASNEAFKRMEVTVTPVVIKESSETKIIFSCSLHAKTKLFKFFEATYSVLFKKLGYGFEQISMPRARETHELSSGKVDGSCGRTMVHESHQPNSIRVKEAILETNIRIWSRIPYGEINSIEEIPVKKSLAVVRGTTYFDKKLEAYNGNVVQTPSMEAGVKMLAAGRVEYLVGFEISFQNLIGETIIESPIYAVGKLDSLKIYPYFHQRRSGLALELEKIMQKNKVSSVN